MSTQKATIRFESQEAWKTQTENVNRILEKHTGTSKYPSTMSLPPIILGLELATEAIDELNSLPGVNV